MDDPSKATGMGEAELLGSRQVFRGIAVDLRVDRVRLPNGHEADLEVISHPGAAVVMPMTTEHEVVLLRQYRYAAGGWLLELPAGKLNPGERPAACAVRELEEEAGFKAGRLDSLGWVWTTPGFTNERIWLFIARDLEPGCQELESEEVLEITSLPMSEVLRRIECGEIQDAKTICTLLLAERFLGRES
ncbi:MAG: NUDIX hydrolase [Acidobacteriota bacterium]|nr:NUDIX hydrolase [Acidobacteriota bacterium]